MRWVGHVAHGGEMRNIYKSLIRDHEGKRQVGRPRRRWEANNKLDPKDASLNSRSV
jgi:hypothetical protein